MTTPLGSPAHLTFDPAKLYLKANLTAPLASPRSSLAFPNGTGIAGSQLLNPFTTALLRK